MRLQLPLEVFNTMADLLRLTVSNLSEAEGSTWEIAQDVMVHVGNIWLSQFRGYELKSRPPSRSHAPFRQLLLYGRQPLDMGPAALCLLLLLPGITWQGHIGAAAAATPLDIGFVVLSNVAQRPLEDAARQTWAARGVAPCFVTGHSVLTAIQNVAELCFRHRPVPLWVLFVALDTYVFVDRLQRVVEGLAPHDRRAYGAVHTCRAYHWNTLTEPNPVLALKDGILLSNYTMRCVSVLLRSESDATRAKRNQPPKSVYV